MAKYIRKMSGSDQTFLSASDGLSVFMIACAMVRYELGLTNTCYVPKIEKVKPIMKRILCDMIICEGDFVIDFNDELYKNEIYKDEDNMVKRINILGLYSLDQDIKISDKYMQVIRSPEFKLWGDNKNNSENNDKLSVREVKRISIDNVLSLIEILRKYEIINV